MTVEENKELLRRIFALTENDADLIDVIVSPEYVGHLSMNNDAHGCEGFALPMRSTRQAFPDYRYDILDMFGEDDRVVVRFTLTGTHLGNWRGIPPTGKRMVRNNMTIYRFDSGKIVESWHQNDVLGALEQLGVPTPLGPTLK